MGHPAVNFGFLPAPLFVAPAELQNKQWIYFAFQPGHGWEHLITMPTSVPIEAIDRLLLTAVNPDAVTAIDRGLFNKAIGRYELFVRVFPT